MVDTLPTLFNTTNTTAHSKSKVYFSQFFAKSSLSQISHVIYLYLYTQPYKKILVKVFYQPPKNELTVKRVVAFKIPMSLLN